MVQPGAAEPGGTHPPKGPVDHGLVNVAYPPATEQWGEPPSVEPSVVGDCALLPPLLAGEVLVQEERNGVVHGKVTEVLPGSGPRAADLGDESDQLASRGVGGPGGDGSVRPFRPAVQRAAGGGGKLPDAGTDLAHRSSTSPVSPSCGRPDRGWDITRWAGRGAHQPQVLDPDAVGLGRAWTNPELWCEWPVCQFPGHPVGRDLATSDLQPTRSPLRVDGSHPAMVVAAAVH